MRWFLLSVFLIPLVMHMHQISVPAEVQKHFEWYQVDNDLFNWGKGVVLYTIGAIAIFWGLGCSRKRGLYFYLICAYLLLVEFSCLMSDFVTVPFWGMPNYCEGAAAIFCYGAIFLASREVWKRKSDEKHVLRFVQVSAWGMACVCLAQIWDPAFLNWPIFKFFVYGDAFSPYNVDNYHPGAVFGTFMNTNVMGTFAALLFPYLLAKKAWVSTAVVAAMAFACNSRAGWVGILAGVWWILLSQRSIRSWRVWAPIAAGLLLMLKFDPRSLADSRFYIWRETFKILPFGLLGDGPGTYALLVKQFGGPWAGSKIVLDRPHDFYLQVWHASGWVSLLVLIGLFLKFFVESRRSPRALPYAAGALGYLVNMLFTDSSTSVAPVFWALLGMGVGAL